MLCRSGKNQYGIKYAVVFVTKPCGLAGGNQHVRGKCCLKDIVKPTIETFLQKFIYDLTCFCLTAITRNYGITVGRLKEYHTLQVSKT